MSTAMQELGIDRMTVAARIELALEIWQCLEGESPMGSLSADDEAELERRDREFVSQSDQALTWGEIRQRIETGHS